MYRYALAVCSSFLLLTGPAFSDNSMAPRGSGAYMVPMQPGVTYPYNVNNVNRFIPGATPQYQYSNPYGSVYGGNSYANGYYPNYVGSYNTGGFSTPVYGVPQLINGNVYGINIGGVPARFWRAPSGFYYPWTGGYGYTSYPIFVVPPNNSTPTQTLPPISTIVTDLNSYLDKAKQNGKIDQANYQSLKQRASDLLSKEKSLAYEAGGTIDPDQEADIRRDIEGLSADVAHRVRP